MFRKIILPLVALMGILFGIFMIHFNAKKPPIVRILFPPPVSPYKHYLAGEGIIESVYKNILIGTSFDEMVDEIYVKIGQIVKKGTPLFKLDTRTFEAQLIQALLEQKVAETNYQNQSIQFSFYEQLKRKAAVSKQAYQTARYNKELAQKRLSVSCAAVNTIKTNIQRSITRAPIDGEILQINVRLGQSVNRVGQSISNNASNKPPILLGDTSFYHLRIDINEEDAWRFISGSKATAFMRGNANIAIPLEFVYLEPYMVPKTSLSGLATERVDTRVLQVVYKFAKEKYPIFVGQQLDVYLEAKPTETAS